jgi:5S rRNA maturation endonuclease (ribonuclease M5)
VDPFCELDFDGLEEPPRRFAVRDAAGRLQATLVRTADKRMWWERPDGSVGLRGLRPADLLYGAERLRHEPLEVPVIVTEGPKDCEACWRAGSVAVGTLTGAGGVPTPAALEPLRDRIVILWPDHDAAGATHMARLADALQGIAREVRLLEVTELPAKAGAADLPVAAMPGFVATHARAYARVSRVGDDSSGEEERSISPDNGAPLIYAHDAHARMRVGTTRASRRERAALRASVRLLFAAPGDAALAELVAAFERIQGRVAKPAQVGYLIRCYRIHGPDTRSRLEALYRERGSTENLLLALEVAPPAWLADAPEADETPVASPPRTAPWPPTDQSATPEDPGPGEEDVAWTA